MQIDSDTAPWVRDKVPVFCEKRTEVVDNTYVTTRGCSVDYRWEDVRGYQDNRRACWSFASWTAPSVEG